MIKKDIKNLKLLREKLIKLAILQLDKKYIHGAHGPDDFDCAGFVWYIYNEICKIDLYLDGYGLSTTTMMMTSKYGKLTLYEEKSSFKNLSLIKPGDILFFHRQAKLDNKPKPNNKYPGHCGIFLDNNNFIHCTSRVKKVVINSLDDDIYWRDILVGYKNIADYDNSVLYCKK